MPASIEDRNATTNPVTSRRTARRPRSGRRFGVLQPRAGGVVVLGHPDQLTAPGRVLDEQPAVGERLDDALVAAAGQPKGKAGRPNLPVAAPAGVGGSILQGPLPPSWREQPLVR